MPIFQPAIEQVFAGTTKALGPAVVFADGGGVTFGMNGNTVTASAPAALAAAAAGTQTQTSGTLVFANSNGMSFGMSGGSQVTGSFDGIKSVSAGTTRGTNGEIVFADSNGMSFGMNGNTVTATHDAFRRVSVDASTLSGSDLVFSDSGGVTFGLTGSTLTANADPGASFYPLYPMIGTGTAVMSIATNTSANMYIWGFTIDRSIAPNASLGVLFSASYVTRGNSAGSNSLGLTLGIFAQGAGTQATQAALVTSWSFGISDSYNNSTLTISFPATTATSGFGVESDTSAGLNVTQLHSGLRRVNFAMGTNLARGHYFLAVIGTQSSSSVSGGNKLSLYGNSYTMSAVHQMGTNNYTSGSRVSVHAGPMYPYIGIWSTAGLNSMPSSFALTDLNLNGVAYPQAMLFAPPS